MQTIPPSTLAAGALCILGAFLAAAVCTDLRSRRIPNLLAAVGIVSGSALNLLLPEGAGFLSGLPGGVGLGGALAGVATGFGLFLPLYALRAIGAGDVKLMAMVGAFLGPMATVYAVLASFLAGGVLGLAVTIYRRTTWQLLANLRTMLLAGFFKILMHEMPALEPVPVSAGRMPYAFAIAAGTLMCIVLKTTHWNLPWFFRAFQ